MSPRKDETTYVEQTMISPCHVLHVVIWHTCILKPWELRPLYLSQFSILDWELRPFYLTPEKMYLILCTREGGFWIFCVLKALERIGASFWCHGATTRTYWRQVSLARAQGVWPGRTHSRCVALFPGFLFINMSFSGSDIFLRVFWISSFPILFLVIFTEFLFLKLILKQNLILILYFGKIEDSLYYYTC